MTESIISAVNIQLQFYYELVSKSEDYLKISWYFQNNYFSENKKGVKSSHLRTIFTTLYLILTKLNSLATIPFKDFANSFTQNHCLQQIYLQSCVVKIISILQNKATNYSSPRSTHFTYWYLSITPKKSENLLMFSHVFSGYRKRQVAWNWLTKKLIKASLISTCRCAYREVKNVSIFENFAYVLYGWSLQILKKCFKGLFEVKILRGIAKWH